MKQLFSLSPLAILIMVMCDACSSSKAVVTKQTFTYDYKTPHTEKLGSANVLISLIRPYYATDFVQRYGDESEIFSNFKKFIGDDIEELLIDKGYRIKSTHPTFEGMTYDEKKEVDVALIIEIVPSFTAEDGGWKEYHPLTWQYPNTTHYVYNASISLIGKINIYGIEPLSHEKIWIKSVDIPSIRNIHIKTGALDAPRIDVNFFNDNSVYNTLGGALQQQYRLIMQQIDTYLDPREFTDLKGQIKELKTRKVY